MEQCLHGLVLSQAQG